MSGRRTAKLVSQRSTRAQDHGCKRPYVDYTFEPLASDKRRRQGTTGRRMACDSLSNASVMNETPPPAKAGSPQSFSHNDSRATTVVQKGQRNRDLLKTGPLFSEGQVSCPVDDNQQPLASSGVQVNETGATGWAERGLTILPPEETVDSQSQRNIIVETNNDECRLMEFVQYERSHSPIESKQLVPKFSRITLTNARRAFSSCWK